MSLPRQVPLALSVACLALLMAAAPVAAGSAICVRHGDRTEKIVALTFDDGWSATRTREIVAILDRARRIAERVTGRPMMRVFWPPYGAWDSRVARQAYKAGFHYLVMWDVDSGDTSRDRTYSRVLRLATSGGKGSIVLMHAGPAITPRVLKDVIANYKSRGFRFVTVGEMFGDAWQ